MGSLGGLKKLIKGNGLWYTILVSEKHFTQNNIKTEEIYYGKFSTQRLQGRLL